MGVQISGVLPSKEITLQDLKGKRLAVDTYIHLYQFLSATPVLTDHLDRITTHLSGIFFRTAHLLSLGIKPVYVFDGPFLEIKKHDKFTKEAAQPRVTSTLSLEMINETKVLLTALGIPLVQAPAEGEAQAAHMCAKGDVFAVASQDYDSLMFGAKRMVKNLSFARKQKQKKGFVYTGVYQYELKDVLNALKLDYNQFVMFCMLVGTDFNPGVEGLGQKNALKVVQKYRTFTRIFEKVKWQYGYLPKAVYEHIKTMPITNKYQLRWTPVDKDTVMNLLVKEHDFNRKRVADTLETL
ncbi:flap structure-specific endonuclease [Candidatus Woesearchaeota archaeon]|nr:flap structure-specific endonuclease [Candidatus Woesearchaeota archaeon]